jgi:hypothetical protein
MAQMPHNPYQADHWRKPVLLVVSMPSWRL